jgi:Flp pilus assembly protein TadG
VKTTWRRLAGERGQALIETALTLPLLLIVSVGIFEFGRAFQTWQVLTNAAREGARVAVMGGSDPGAAEARVRQYLHTGGLPDDVAASATVVVNPIAVVGIGGAGTATATIVTVNYPFAFMVLQPVARLLVSGSTLGAPVTLTASAEMRNESQ